MEIFTFRIDSRFRAHLEGSSTEPARRETYLRAKRDENNPGKAFDIVVLNNSLRDWCWLRPFPIALGAKRRSRSEAVRSCCDRRHERQFDCRIEPFCSSAVSRSLNIRADTTCWWRLAWSPDQSAITESDLLRRVLLAGTASRATPQALISRDLYDRVQAVFAAAHHRRRTKRQHAFVRLVTCGRCGCPVTAEIKKGNTSTPAHRVPRTVRQSVRREEELIRQLARS